MRSGLPPVVMTQLRVEFESNDSPRWSNESNEVVLYQDGSAVVIFLRVKIRRRVYGGRCHIGGGVVEMLSMYPALGEPDGPVTDAAREAMATMAARMYRRAVWEARRRYSWVKRTRNS